MSNENETNKKDTFDLARIALVQNYGQMLTVKHRDTVVSVRKPMQQEWVAVSPNQNHHTACMVLEYKRDKKFYLMSPEVAELLVKDSAERHLILCQTKSGEYFFWPVSLGSNDTWSKSARNIVSENRNKWLRIIRDQENGEFEARIIDSSPASWTDDDLATLISKTAKDHLIEDASHPVVRDLLGQ